MSEFFRIIGNGTDDVTEVIHHFPIGTKVRRVGTQRRGIYLYEDASGNDSDPMIQYVESRHVEPTDE